MESPLDVTLVGAQLREAFVHFARTGAPAAEAMPEWPAYTAENDAWMVIGSRPVVRRGVIRGRLDLIEEFDIVIGWIGRGVQKRLPERLWGSSVLRPVGYSVQRKNFKTLSKNSI